VNSRQEPTAIDEALARLDQEDHVKVELVKLRYFAGLTLEEAGRILGIWAFA
jgi:DNA-directed RNA polymerase specialized sigma24 family protein